MRMLIGRVTIVCSFQFRPEEPKPPRSPETPASARSLPAPGRARRGLRPGGRLIGRAWPARARRAVRNFGPFAVARRRWRSRKAGFGGGGIGGVLFEEDFAADRWSSASYQRCPVRSDFSERLIDRGERGVDLARLTSATAKTSVDQGVEKCVCSDLGEAQFASRISANADCSQSPARQSNQPSKTLSAKPIHCAISWSRARPKSAAAEGR